jgi:hypothetical protein
MMKTGSRGGAGRWTALPAARQPLAGAGERGARSSGSNFCKKGKDNIDGCPRSRRLYPEWT